MFEYLKDYKYIFVTGMQRTGTTICMRMIQYDIEAPYCIWVGFSPDRIANFEEQFPLEISYPVIFHCPGLSHMIHQLQDETEFAVVWMKRDRKEILVSAIREIWDPRQSLQAYGIPSTGDQMMDLNSLIDAKESGWEKQKEHIKNWFEVDYESLRSHRLWINDKDRPFRRNHRSTSLGIDKIMKDVPRAWEGGELEHLLKEFPKDDK